MNPMVGGAAMLRSRDIVDNAVNSADHTTLVAAVKAAGLVDTLKSRAHSRCLRQPTRLSTNCRRAPSKLWSSPRTRTTLTKILTYHVLAGKFDSKAIAKTDQSGNGKAEFTTVSGDTLDRDDERQRAVLTR